MIFHSIHLNILGALGVIFGPIVRHVKVLYGQFDPVLDVPSSISIENLHKLATYRKRRVEADRAKHRFFLIPFVIFVFNIFDTLYVLPMDDFDYYNRRMPQLLYHKMYPEAFWYQSDMIIFSIVLCSLVVYYNLWLGIWLDDRFCMYAIQDEGKGQQLIVNNKVWDQANAAKIFAFRKSNSRFRKICMFCSYFFFQPYFQYVLWAKPERGFRQNFLSCYLSIFLCYTVSSVIMLFYHFFIASKYILLKQSYFLNRFNRLLESLRNPVKRKATIFHRLYGEWHSLNQDLAYQGKEISGFNTFWSIYLTAQFASNIFCVGYLVYCYIFIPATLDLKMYYAVASLELGGLVFAVIYRCSHIDGNNDLAYDRNVKIAILFQKHYRMNPRLMANIDTIATNRNFSRYCFGLKNSYRLDSTAFNMAFFILSTFFMSITKKAQQQKLGI